MGAKIDSKEALSNNLVDCLFTPETMDSILNELILANNAFFDKQTRGKIAEIKKNLYSNSIEVCLRVCLTPEDMLRLIDLDNM